MESDIQLTQSAEIGALVAAMAKAQGEMKAALKDSANPFFKSKYADLGSVWEACRAALSKNEVAVFQPIQVNGCVYLDTLIAHSSGQWIRGRAPVKPAKDDPQGLGSAITYMRRYSLAAMVGVVADEDDDGEAAMSRHPASPPQQIKGFATAKEKAAFAEAMLKRLDGCEIKEDVDALKRLVHLDFVRIERADKSLAEIVRDKFNERKERLPTAEFVGINDPINHMPSDTGGMQ